MEREGVLLWQAGPEWHPWRKKPMAPGPAGVRRALKTEPRTHLSNAYLKMRHAAQRPPKYGTLPATWLHRT